VCEDWKRSFDEEEADFGQNEQAVGRAGRRRE